MDVSERREDLCGDVEEKKKMLSTMNLSNISKSSENNKNGEIFYSKGELSKPSNLPNTSVREFRSKSWLNVIDGNDISSLNCTETFPERNIPERPVNLMPLNKGEYSCRRCTQTCGQIGNLKSHVHSVHEDRGVYACKACASTFGKSGNLKKYQFSP